MPGTAGGKLASAATISWKGSTDSSNPLKPDEAVLLSSPARSCRNQPKVVANYTEKRKVGGARAIKLTYHKGKLKRKAKKIKSDQSSKPRS